MSDTITVREACQHGYYEIHAHDDRSDGFCPGGREIVARRALGETLLADVSYWVIGEVDDDE